MSVEHTIPQSTVRIFTGRHPRRDACPSVIQLSTPAEITELLPAGSTEECYLCNAGVVITVSHLQIMSEKLCGGVICTKCALQSTKEWEALLLKLATKWANEVVKKLPKSINSMQDYGNAEDAAGTADGVNIVLSMLIEGIDAEIDAIAHIAKQQKQGAA